jgi:hypothetical protein
MQFDQLPWPIAIASSRTMIDQRLPCLQQNYRRIYAVQYSTPYGKQLEASDVADRVIWIEKFG